MLTAVLVTALLWTILGGALAIVDADNGNHRRQGGWVLWLAIYGPCLWVLVALITIQEGGYRLFRKIERKLRG